MTLHRDWMTEGRAIYDQMKHLHFPLPTPSSPKAIYFQPDGEARGGIYGAGVSK